MTDLVHHLRKLVATALRACVLLAGLLTLPLAHAAPERPFYAAIFGISIDESGTLSGFRLDRVLDPLSGSKEPVDVKVPDQYIEAARTLVLSKHYPPKLENGKPKEFFTYFYYVPSQPDRADLDPRKMPELFNAGTK
jgi:hypothetical protein